MDIGSMGDINFSSEDAILFFVQLFCSLRGPFFVDVEDGDSRSLLVNGFGDREPHTASAAGHDRILILKTVTHIFLLLRQL
jgi:hypothetical protein